MIDVIDYGGGNIGSLLRCLERLAVPYQTVSAHNLPQGKNPLLLPGVGAFGATMANLSQNGLAQRIIELVQQGLPYLGICVGLQVLLDHSEEDPGVAGLGLIPGTVKRFQAAKVPQVGWNYIHPQKQTPYEPGYVYFVNSYYALPHNKESVLYQAHYETDFCAGIQWQNITAFQFHPEKSGAFGHKIIKGWIHGLS